MANVKLASTMCPTCIFRPGAPFDLDEFRRRWGAHGHQTCHQFRIKGQRRATHPDVWCRGFWENEMPADTRAVLEACELVEIIPQRKEK